MSLKRIIWMLAFVVFSISTLLGCRAIALTYDFWGKVPCDGWPSTYLAEELSRKVKNITSNEKSVKDAIEFVNSEGFAKTVTMDSHLSSSIKEHLRISLMCFGLFSVITAFGACYSLVKVVILPSTKEKSGANMQ